MWLCIIHLNRIYSVAEYFLQNRQVVSVHGGHFSLLKLGREPVWKDAEVLSCNINHLFLWGVQRYEKAAPPSTSSYLQSLGCADGLHVLLPFVINGGLYEAVENYSLDTPEEQKRDTALEGRLAPAGKCNTLW